MKIEKPEEPFNGQHCETPATEAYLRANRIELSEPMLFGLGEGLGFIYWIYENDGFPFHRRRIKLIAYSKFS